jgi:hypothetical protein
MATWHRGAEADLRARAPRLGRGGLQNNVR